MAKPTKTRAKDGDNRTPDKTIGEVKYAEGHDAPHNDGGQNLPCDKEQAMRSQEEGPAAYAPHDQESIRGKPNRNPAKKNEF